MPTAGRNPANLDLDIYQGDPFELRLQWEDADGDPINQTGFTFAAQVRRYESSNAIAASFDVDMTNASTGIVLLTLSAEDTAGLQAGPYRWDAQKDGAPYTFLAGEVTVTAQVTRT
jgi:hypothetical protein